MLAKLASIRSGHDTVVGIAFTSPVAFTQSRMILLASTSIKAGVVVLSAHNKLDFTLQTGVPNGTDAVHAVFVANLFPWKFFVFVNTRVGTKLAVPVPTLSTIVAVQVAVKIVGGCGLEGNHEGKHPYCCRCCRGETESTGRHCCVCCSCVGLLVDCCC